MNHRNPTFRLATVARQSFVVGLGILAVSCGCNNDEQSCPVFDVTQWCADNAACTATGGMCSGSQCTLAAGEVLDVPIGRFADQLTGALKGKELRFHVDRTDLRFAPTSVDMNITLDGVEPRRIQVVGDTIVVLVWEPFPNSPQNLRVESLESPGRSTNVSMQFIGPCEPKECADE